jgi:hypothetical protein
MAWLMVIFGLVGVPIGMLNELNNLAVLQLLSGADYLNVFTTEQLQALAYFFIQLHVWDWISRSSFRAYGCSQWDIWFSSLASCPGLSAFW